MCVSTRLRHKTILVMEHWTKNQGLEVTRGRIGTPWHAELTDLLLWNSLLRRFFTSSPDYVR